MSDTDPFSSKKEFPLGGHYHALDSLDSSGLDTSSLPYSIRVLLEGALRNCDGFLIEISHHGVLMGKEGKSRSVHQE